MGAIAASLTAYSTHKDVSLFDRNRHEHNEEDDIKGSAYAPETSLRPVPHPQ
jgi:hypothetical protein